MPLTAAKIALPKSVAVATVSKAKGTSTIAQLSPSEPQLFLDKEYITFDGAAEAEVVSLCRLTGFSSRKNLAWAEGNCPLR